MGADHGGFHLKEILVQFLSDNGYDVTDLGTDSTDSTDYPDYAESVSRAVIQGAADLGILCCTSGIGMSIAANRHAGIRAAYVTTPEEAATTRTHNHANVICLSGASLDKETAEKIIGAFLEARPDEHERHCRRVHKIDASASAGLAFVRERDPKIADGLDREFLRQQQHVELIASENFTSPAVCAAQGSVLTNKYAEGYPGRRYYGGCVHVDEVEQLAIDRAKEIFGADHANVQPHAGAQANTAVYFSVLKPGDRILTMDLAHGGHLTHGHKLNFSGLLYDVTHYGVSKDTETIDYDALRKSAEKCRPKMITAGASAYPRTIDFERMGEIARSVDAYLFVDMAHIAGLVAAGVHPSPVPYADFVSSTTHKSLRGPRGGLILCREKYIKAINRAVFPCVQGGPLMHVIAAKAVCFHEALQPEFKDYQQQIIANAARLAARLEGHGFRIVSGGTDNHLMLIDLSSKNMTGADAEETLDRVAITVNKNMIPFDTQPPMKASGIRIGTPAVTTRGMKEGDMDKIADWMAEAVEHRDDSAALGRIRESVIAWNTGFPLPV